MHRFHPIPWLAAAVLASVLPAQAQTAAPSPQLQARALAATCANCHGTQGRAQGAMPALAGMPAEQLLAAMAAFKNGSRPATLMHQIAKGYTDEQVKLLAGYFAAQSPAPTR